MKKIFKPDSKEYQFFQIYIAFAQEFAEVENSNEYWERATRLGMGLIKKYNGDQYVKDLVMALLKALERKQLEGNHGKRN